MTQGWEKAKISHKFSTPSWKATILAKWSRPSAILCTTLNANTNTAWTKHKALTVLPVLLLQVFHYRSKTSRHCLFDFSANDCDLMHFVSQHKYKYFLDQYNTLTPFILLLQVLHLSKTSRHCLCDFSTDDCDLMHFVSSKFPTFDLQRRFRASSMLQDWETAGKMEKLWIWYLKT